MIKETRPRAAVVVAVLTANTDYMGRVGKYTGLLVYHDKDLATSPPGRPILGWTIEEIPQATSGGKFMTLLFYKKGLNMVIIDQAMGEQMIEVCHAAEVATG